MQIAKVANNEQQNYNEEIALSEFSYDDKGRLVQNLLCNRQDTILYSYDIRNMLTGTRNRHFTERLFYADILPPSIRRLFKQVECKQIAFSHKKSKLARFL